MLSKVLLWMTIAYFLYLWTGVLSPIQAEESLTRFDNDFVNGEKQFGNDTILCADNGCISSRGRCGSYWFMRCQLRNPDLCSGFCTCCIPCGGPCGANNKGLCKSSCGWDEVSIDTNNNCGNAGCTCCVKSQDCGGRCGENNSYYCRRWYSCPFWYWVSGNCTGSSCTCCRS